MAEELSVRESIKKLMKEQNYDPFREMIRIAKDPDTDYKTRANMAAELAQYLAPKLKGVDIEAKGGFSLNVLVKRFAEELANDDTPKTKTLDIPA